jgi:hypothetical protein
VQGRVRALIRLRQPFGIEPAARRRDPKSQGVVYGNNGPDAKEIIAWARERGVKRSKSPQFNIAYTGGVSVKAEQRKLPPMAPTCNSRSSIRQCHSWSPCTGPAYKNHN